MAPAQSTTTQRKSTSRTGRGQGRSQGRTKSGARSGGARSSGTRQARSGGRTESSRYEEGSAFGHGLMHDTRTAKVIELVASSTESFEDAIRSGLEDARETLHNINGCDVRNFTVKCEDGEPIEYRVDLKVAFGIER